MRKEIETGMQNVQEEPYEVPRMEVIEMEMEGPILQFSGEDGDKRPW